MFTWICPKCGREVPPSYSECPNCTVKDVPANPPAADASKPSETGRPVDTPRSLVLPPEPTYVEPVRSYPAPIAPPSPPRSFDLPPSLLRESPPEPPPPAKSALQGVLVTVLVAVGMVAVLAGAYFLFGTKKSSADSSVPASAPAAAKSAPAKSSHPFAKYLEIAGLRVKEGARNGLNLQFVVINHSAADLPEMKMNIKVFSDKKDIYDFPFTVPAIGPFESKEFSIPMKTELKPYELPDWQYLNSQFEITSAP